MLNDWLVPYTVTRIALGCQTTFEIEGRMVVDSSELRRLATFTELRAHDVVAIDGERWVVTAIARSASGHYVATLARHESELEAAVGDASEPFQIIR